MGLAISRYFAAMIMPGMQKPHCTAPLLDECLLQRIELAAGREPFDRDDLRIGRLGASTRQDVTARPFSSTVHAPHSPSLQHSLVPVRPARSRSVSSSVW